MDDATWARVFEVLSVATTVGMWYVIRARLGGNPHLYAGMLACASLIVWEWYMDIGPMQFGYSHEFIDIWTHNGIILPAMIPFAWIWYWWLPNLVLLPNIKWLDDHWGRWQYLWIFLLGGIWNLVVELPGTQVSDLWTYYWKDSWLVAGGVPWLNVPNGGLNHLLVFVFARYLWTRYQGKTLRDLYLPYLAAMNLAFYLTWLPFTYILGKTQSYWHV